MINQYFLTVSYIFIDFFYIFGFVYLVRERSKAIDVEQAAGSPDTGCECPEDCDKISYYPVQLINCIHMYVKLGCILISTSSTSSL